MIFTLFPNEDSVGLFYVTNKETISVEFAFCNLCEVESHNNCTNIMEVFKIQKEVKSMQNSYRMQLSNSWRESCKIKGGS